MNGLKLIKEERKRQITEEGWTIEHDDLHKSGELAHAGTAYLNNDISWFPLNWDSSWFKTGTRARDLTKAGALYQAEIERLERLKKEIIKELDLLM